MLYQHLSPDSKFEKLPFLFFLYSSRTSSWTDIWPDIRIQAAHVAPSTAAAYGICTPGARCSHVNNVSSDGRFRVCVTALDVSAMSFGTQVGG